MNKEEFLQLLKKRLAYLNSKEIKRHLDFYEEAINDRMDDGMSEFDAVKDLGDLADIVNTIKVEYNESEGKDTKEEIKNTVVNTVNDTIENIDVKTVTKKVTNKIMAPVTVISTFFTVAVLLLGLGLFVFSLINLTSNISTVLILFCASFATLGLGLLLLGLTTLCFKSLKNNKEETQ